MNHSKSNFGLVKENSGSRTAMDADETDFLTTADAARFVREKAAREKRPYRVTRSDRTRFCVACVDKMCPFQVRFWRRRDGKFHITRNVAHTCTLFQTTVTPAWIKDVVKESLTNNAALTTAELRDIVSTRTQAEIAWKKVYYARTRVVGETDAGASSFRKLTGLLQRITESNPGTVTDILSTGSTYKALFLCLGACIEAFAHCHSILFVDGCHVKAPCGGVLLFASSIDGNDRSFPSRWHTRQLKMERIGSGSSHSSHGPCLWSDRKLL